MSEREVAEALTRLEAALVERGFGAVRGRREGDTLVLSLGWPVKLMDWERQTHREVLWPFTHQRPLSDLLDVTALADDLRGDPATTPYDALWPEPGT